MTPPGEAGTCFPAPIPDVIDFGTVNILAGAPGVGKTTMFAEWEARWRDGRTICGHQTNRPPGLAYLSADRGGASTKRILDCHKLLDGTWTTYYNPLDDQTFDRKLLRNHLVALETLRWCVQRFTPAIIPGSHLVIDPPAPLFVPGSQNDPRSVAALLWELHVIARELQITIFLLCHFAKQLADIEQRYRRPQDRISGSGAWSGFSDTQMYLCDPEPPAQPYHIVGWNPRNSAPKEYKLIRQGSLFVPYRSLEDTGNLVRIGIPESAYQLFCLIPDEGCTTAVLREAAAGMFGMARSTVFLHLSTLEAKGVVTRTHGFVKRVPIEEVVMIPDGESEVKPN